jgi:DNA replication and repair protein RecF
MNIERIRLLNFRNYEILDLRGLSSGVNILYGKNAQGKTNLLEAIHICANGKTFRGGKDAKAVRFFCKRGYAQTEYRKRGRMHTIEALIYSDGKKSFKKDGKSARSIRETIGELLVVVFSPEDIRMAKEAPVLRRAFLDGEISKIRPFYLDALKQYRKIIFEKNAALKKRAIGDVEGLMRAYNEQLEQYIRIILKNRRMYLEKLNKHIDILHKTISSEEKKIEIQYKGSMQEEKIAEQLERMVEREIDECGCFAGPHRDDIEIRIDNKDVKQYASQGQLRTLMLTIKIACLKILEDSTGETPILLLDDVFSELDESRKQNLLCGFDGIQVFLTTANEQDAVAVMDAAKYWVSAGKIAIKA